MCRFVLYLGNEIPISALVTEPENSVINQSFDSHERSEPLNGDGFGVAWYKPEISPDAAQFRAITPAWNNQNLIHLARMTRSGCILAHVRAASPHLAVTETNTHPFVHGRLAFMHNGDVAAFPYIRRALLDSLGDEAYGLIQGTTDSEHLFALFVDSLGSVEDAGAERMADALEEAIRRLLTVADRMGIDGDDFLNIAVANGREAVVCRYSRARSAPSPSLHLHTGKLYACHEGASKLLQPADDDHAVIVASEPLTEDESWKVVEDRHMVVIDSDRGVRFRPLDLS